MNTYFLSSIGKIVNERIDLSDDGWGNVRSLLILNAEVVSPDSIAGIGEFSHLEVVFLMHRVDNESICRSSRHPRGRMDFPKTGILAQRAKDRPNRIGVSRCSLIAISGMTIEVTGLDAVNNTPILDIKPYMLEFGPRGEVRQPKWATEIMKEYY